MPNWVRRLVFTTPLRTGLLLHRADRGGGEDVRRHLDGAVTALLDGYRAALDDDDAERISARLAELPDLVRGFAYEGAGAALTLLDRFLPGPRVRFQALLRGPGAPYAITMVGMMIAVFGVGYAIVARNPAGNRGIVWIGSSDLGQYDSGVGDIASHRTCGVLGVRDRNYPGA